MDDNGSGPDDGPGRDTDSTSGSSTGGGRAVPGPAHRHKPDAGAPAEGGASAGAAGGGATGTAGAAAGGGAWPPLPPPGPPPVPPPPPPLGPRSGRRGAVLAGAAAAVLVTAGIVVAAVAAGGGTARHGGGGGGGGPRAGGPPARSASAGATATATDTPTRTGTPAPAGGTAAPPALHVSALSLRRLACSPTAAYTARGTVTVTGGGAGTLTLLWFHSPYPGARGALSAAQVKVPLRKGQASYTGSFSHTFGSADDFPYWGLQVTTTPAPDTGNASTRAIAACRPGTT